MSEAELVEALKQQKRDAYEYAYSSYKDLVFNTISNYVTHTNDAEELVQAVFVKAFRKINQFRGEAQFSTWLVKISKNTALNFLELIKTKVQSSIEYHAPVELEEILDNEFSSDYLNPEEFLLNKEGKYILQNAFTKLTKDQHLACKLFYIEGLTQLEVAESMDMSLDAVESLIYRGKVKLRSILKNKSL